MSAKGDYFPNQGANLWFANSKYSADVSIDGTFLANLSPKFAPVAAAAANVLGATDVTNTGSTTTFATGFANSEAQMTKFGRNVVVVGSAASMAQVITVKGFDYLNQPMTETLTLNATTPVIGVKAFRQITNISWVSGTAGNLTVGLSNGLGVPYAVMNNGGAFLEQVSGVQAGTAGTLALQVATAQTATSADPRGLYTPHSSLVPNGVRTYKIAYEPNRDNLLGLAHFSS